MVQLNYHHLRYFREVAMGGHLVQAAERLNVSQSALSTQIRQLEERLGHALFDRVGRRLVLTEAGKIALDHAERIFSEGNALLATLDLSGDVDRPLRIGALSTLSRNFQMQFIRPLLDAPRHRIVLRSGNTATLLAGLEALSLDVVLTTEVPVSGGDARFAAQKIAEQAVGVHGHPARLQYDSLSELLSNEPLILPTENVIRAGFENLCARMGIIPRIVADVDDMAMVRLLARENTGLAIAPAVVLADEIASGRLVSAPFDLDITEPFFAVTVPRSFAHPALRTLTGV